MYLFFFILTSEFLGLAVELISVNRNFHTIFYVYEVFITYLLSFLGTDKKIGGPRKIVDVNKYDVLKYNQESQLRLLFVIIFY